MTSSTIVAHKSLWRRCVKRSLFGHHKCQEQVECKPLARPAGEKGQDCKRKFFIAAASTAGGMLPDHVSLRAWDASMYQLIIKHPHIQQ